MPLVSGFFISSLLGQVSFAKRRAIRRSRPAKLHWSDYIIKNISNIAFHACAFAFRPLTEARCDDRSQLADRAGGAKALLVHLLVPKGVRHG